MSRKSGPGRGRSKNAGWSGGSKTRDQPLHRWQDPNAAAEAAGARRRRQRNRWFAVSVLAVGLLALLVYQLLPTGKTPLIVVIATNYSAPVPLNSWAREDFDSLRELDRGSFWDNIWITDLSERWNDSGEPRAPLVTEELIPKVPSGQPLIIYVNMHGIVNDAGDPCLLHPDASITNSKSWKPVAELLGEIRATVPEKLNKLLILDCNRIRVNWNLGILYNSFTERLKELVETENVPNLAVLTSAGPGQVSWASADLAGSAFGRYLQLGLAGQADEDSEDSDGKVSLQELTAYLQREVSAWSRSNRGEPQTPTLILPQEADDFRVTGAIGGPKLAELVEKFLHPQELRRPPHISPEDFAALWDNLDEMRAHDLVRYDPVACRKLEHELLRLEDLSHAGRAYRDEAEKLFDELEKRLSESVEVARAAATSRALADHLKVLEILRPKSSTWSPPVFTAHTLPVCEYFGACRSNHQVDSLWNKLIDSSSRQEPNAIVEGFTEEGKERAKDLAETQFLLALRRQQVRSLWQPPRDIDLAEVLERRSTAERLAVPLRDGAPGDERAHYFVRRALKSADRKRREAEDILFIGERNAPTSYQETAANAQQLYEATDKIWKNASDALQIYDAALHETPHLAAWLCSPLANHDANRRNLVKDQLLPLIRATRDLGTMINQFPSAPDNSMPFAERRDEVETHLAELKRSFNSEADRLSASGSQGTNESRAMEAMLTVPLKPAEAAPAPSDTEPRQPISFGKRRAQLWTNYMRICAELHQRKNEPVATNTDPNTSYLTTIRDWGAHPLMEILQPDGAQTETSDDNHKRLEWCDKSAASARSRLKDIVANRPTTLSENEQLKPVLRERLKLSHAERDLRATAAICFDPEQTSDAIDNLRRFDLQQLLIWHGQRALDDFWGDVASPIEIEPFFARAASDYFNAAESIRDPSSAVRQQIEMATTLLEKRRQAKSGGLSIKVVERRLKDVSSADVEVSLAIAANSSEGEFPPGQAALYLQDESRRLMDLKAEASADGAGVVTLPSDASQAFKFHIPAKLTADALKAVTFFRGREDSAEFALPTLGGVRIAYEPHQYERQQITLFGDRQQQIAIVFVLDCSGSMQALVPLEVQVAGQGKEMQRMDLAKQHFMAMLEHLADRNLRDANTQVGVWFFGHRAGIRNRNVALNPNWPGRKEANLRPSQDVERILPLRQFRQEELGYMREKVKAIKAWGITPLYLALLKALDDFDDAPRGADKSIIAITDGKNDQKDPENIAGRVAPITSLDELIRNWQQRSVRIPIHILGFDLAEDEARAARDEYTRLAKETQGSWKEVGSGNELLEALRERLELDGYLVLDDQQRPVNPVTGGKVKLSRLNDRVEITTSLPQRFTVSFRSIRAKQVELEGGEAIELYVRDGEPQDIVALPYDGQPGHIGRDVVRDGERRLIGGERGDATDYVLRVHRPISDGASVRFPISLQRNPNAPSRPHFTPRPKETWVEITPVRGTADVGEAYLFYDTNFEPDEPVPVLEWTADEWPENADRARIRFWCKYQATTAVPIPLRDVVNSPDRFGELQSLPNIRGVDLSIKLTESPEGDYRISVEERHREQPRRIDAIRVQLDTKSDVKPKHVSHQFDSKNGYVTHTYDFSPALRERLEQTAEILIATSEDVKDGALQLPADRELVVPIQRGGDYHAPSGASGR